MLDAAELDAYRRLPTSTWSDALDEFRISGVVRGLSQRSGHGRFAGFAITARGVSSELGNFPKSAFAVGKLLAAVQAGHVLAIAVNGPEASCFGGLAALAAKNRGAAAVIIDGACRDLDEIRQTELWLASRTVTPITGKTRLRIEAIGEPIELGGVLVGAHDLIVGDETGVIVVPGPQLPKVFHKAQALADKDAEVARLLAAGSSFTEAATAAHYL
jgi:regulator of RNase E activity RraA